MTALLVAGFVLLIAICAAIQYAYGTYRMNRASSRLPWRQDPGRPWRSEDFQKPPNEDDLL